MELIWLNIIDLEFWLDYYIIDMVYYKIEISLFLISVFFFNI